MKHAHKYLIIASLLSALGLATAAQTPSAAPETGMGPGHMMRSHEGHGRYDPAKMQERITQHLTQLKQKLNITPAQEAAWASYTAAMKPPQVNRPDPAEWAKLSTPERIDRRRTERNAHIAEMDKRDEATKAFYAALSPEQKKTFDEQAMARHRHGHRAKG